MNQTTTGYDLIGDLHGHATELKTLLQKMGYHLRDHVWQHPERKAIFVGDYIDRGPEIRETLYIVKSMVDAGAAYAIMGNHEYNALAFSYHHPDGGYIRPHSEKNIHQHYQTIKQFQGYEKEWDEYLAWFANLPLFLELDGIRAVHACWQDAHIDFLKKLEGPLTRDMLLKAHIKHSPEWTVFEETLKGVEMKLPDGQSFQDKDGAHRAESRVKWWLNPAGLTYSDYFFNYPPELEHVQLPKEIDAQPYSPDAPPVFFGHYWLNPKFAAPAKQAENVVCLDYSVAKGGVLVGFRYSTDNNGEIGFVITEAVAG